MPESNERLLEKYKEDISYSKRGLIERLYLRPLWFAYSRSLLLYHLLSKRTVKAELKPFWGGNMTLVLPYRKSHELFILGYLPWEHDMVNYILRYLKPGMVFFDVGAHFGYYTLFSSKIVGNLGQVHSFEPTKSAFDILRHNTRQLRNVHVNNIAVFSTSGKLLFNDYGMRFSGENSFYTPRSGNPMGETTQYEVETITLDEYVFGRGVRPDFIKIDAESSEYEILHGMVRTLEEYKPIVAMEVGDLLVPSVVPCRETVSFLLEFGYKAYSFDDDWRIVESGLMDSYPPGNMVFLPA